MKGLISICLLICFLLPPPPSFISCRSLRLAFAANDQGRLMVCCLWFYWLTHTHPRRFLIPSPLFISRCRPRAPSADHAKQSPSCKWSRGAWYPMLSARTLSLHLLFDFLSIPCLCNSSNCSLLKMLLLIAHIFLSYLHCVIYIYIYIYMCVCTYVRMHLYHACILLLNAIAMNTPDNVKPWSALWAHMRLHP